MAVYSMTGYATAQGGIEPARGNPEVGREPHASIGIEIRSVNSRFLDLGFRLADELRGAEPVLRELLGSHLRRGKVEVRAWVEGRHENALRMPSVPDLQRLLLAQEHIRSWSPAAPPLSVAEFMHLADRPALDPSLAQATLMRLAHKALQELLAARAREGDRLTVMLRDRLSGLRGLVTRATPLVPALVTQQRQRFLERWRDALGEASAANAEAAHERALHEAAAYAIRIDVAEELSRLQAHLDEMDRLLGQGQELGKRLDFLIQELHREANTLGSKSASLELTRISVDMKVLIEQMREQVQNLE